MGDLKERARHHEARMRALVAQILALYSNAHVRVEEELGWRLLLNGLKNVR